MFDYFDLYGCSIGPDYEELILEAQDREDYCPGDCCHCYYASTCPDCEDGGVQ